MTPKQSLPRASVVMAARNVAPYLSASIGSILKQSQSDFEFLIMDDASTDETWGILQDWASKDARIRIFRGDVPLGPPGCINHLILKARSQYVAIMDADDVAAGQRLKAQIEALDQSGADICCGSYVEFPAKNIRVLSEPMTDAECKISLLFEWTIMQPTVMIRRQLLLSEPYRPEMIPAADYDLWARLAPRARIVMLSDVLLLKRTHRGQISTRRAKDQLSSAMRVRRMALEAMNVVPNDRELSLHSQIWTADRPKSWQDIIDTEIWLCRLARCLYEKPSAIEHISRRWYKYCLKSAPYGFRTYLLFRRSALAKLGSYAILDHLAVLALSLLRVPYQSSLYWAIFALRPPSRKSRGQAMQLPPELRKIVLSEIPLP